MKNIFIISVTAIFLSSCAGEQSRVPHVHIPAKHTLTHKAYSWLGLQEVRDRDLISKLTSVDPVTTEWCAAFVNMVLLQNGHPTSEDVSPYPLMARSFLEWGNPVNKPEQGDVVIFTRGNSGWQGHVGFYVSTKIINGQPHYSVLGGNQDDAVSIKQYPVSDLIGIRRSPVVINGTRSRTRTGTP